MSVLTKKALANSLLKLLEEKTLDDITVINIVEHCGVNRQTFYYHFKSVNGLLEYIFETMLEKSVGENKTYKTWQKGLENVLNFVLKNKVVILNIANSSNNRLFSKSLNIATYNFLYHVIEEISSRKYEISNASKSYIAKFYMHAFVGMIFDWAEDGMKEKPKKIIANLNTLIEGDFEDKIKRFSVNELK